MNSKKSKLEEEDTIDDKSKLYASNKVFASQLDETINLDDELFSKQKLNDKLNIGIKPNKFILTEQYSTKMNEIDNQLAFLTIEDGNSSNITYTGANGVIINNVDKIISFENSTELNKGVVQLSSNINGSSNLLASTELAVSKKCDKLPTPLQPQELNSLAIFDSSGNLSSSQTKISTDSTFNSNSDSLVPTEKAIKSYLSNFSPSSSTTPTTPTTINLTGDVTGTLVGNNIANTISNNHVSNSKLAQMQPKTWKGNNSLLVSNPTDNVSGDLTETKSSCLTINGGSNSCLSNVQLTLNLPNNKIFLGDSNNVPKTVDVSGDITIANNGVTSIKSNVNLTGNPTTTTQLENVNNTTIATTAYTDRGLAKKQDKIPNTLNLSNFLIDSQLGLASATVDIFEKFSINQTSPKINLTIPNPTNIENTKLIFVENIGTVAFHINELTIIPNNCLLFIWNGNQWSHTAGPYSNVIEIKSQNNIFSYTLEGLSSLLLVDCTSGNVEIILPSIHSKLIGLGVKIKKVGSTSNKCIVRSGVSGNFIEKLTSFDILNNDSIEITCTNLTNYNIVSNYSPPVALDSTTVSSNLRIRYYPPNINGSNCYRGMVIWTKKRVFIIGDSILSSWSTNYHNTWDNWEHTWREIIINPAENYHLDEILDCWVTWVNIVILTRDIFNNTTVRVCGLNGGGQLANNTTVDPDYLYFYRINSGSLANKQVVRIWTNSMYVNGNDTNNRSSYIVKCIDNGQITYHFWGYWSNGNGIDATVTNTTPRQLTIFNNIHVNFIIGSPTITQAYAMEVDEFGNSLPTGGRLWCVGHNSNWTLPTANPNGTHQLTYIQANISSTNTNKVTDSKYISLNYYLNLGYTFFVIRHNEGKNTLFACGRNDYFQIGRGTSTAIFNGLVECTTTSLTPLENVVSVKQNSRTTVALLNNGDLWGCGNNDAQTLIVSGVQHRWRFIVSDVVDYWVVVGGQQIEQLFINRILDRNTISEHIRTYSIGHTHSYRSGVGRFHDTAATPILTFFVALYLNRGEYAIHYNNSGYYDPSGSATIRPYIYTNKGRLLSWGARDGAGIPFGAGTVTYDTYPKEHPDLRYISSIFDD